MKFTILSHAGLSVEHNGVKIISDPWLIGSCYWRSWWNFPEPPAELIANLQPDFIYLTHLHWDHFHGPSLRKLFAPETQILVPKVHTTRMLRDLEWLGFKNVTEVPHGSQVTLGEDFTLTSYQFGTSVDSAMLLSGGGYTLFNCNDSKCFGLPLQQITRKFPKIDFILRSHSSANAIPHCIEDYESSFANLRSQQDYIEEFSHFALHIGARYAIPFASNHCFLHKETFHFNNNAVRPEAIRPYYQQLAAKLHQESECVIMPPGSTWSEQEGFAVLPFDHANLEDYLEKMLVRHSTALTQQYEKEQQTVADFEAFQTYFQNFLNAMPWVLRKLLKLQFVFRTRDQNGEHNWLVDMVANKVEALSGNTKNYAVIETPAVVLNDCTQIWMFSAWTPSKRLKIYLPTPGHLSTINVLFALLDLYELEVFPLTNNLSWRSVGVWSRRWRDLVEAAQLILKHKVLKRPFVVANLYPLAPLAAKPETA
jgi:UDP-MurNAc hydroxylase